MEMKRLKALVTILFSLFLYTNLSIATDYTVGGVNGNGWSESTDFDTWASAITFLQGDNLIFRFTINHDVTEVSKADYDSCTTTTPLQPPFTGGSAVVPLDTPGSRYFICQTSGHCITGMKLVINTLPNEATPPPATPPAPTTSPVVNPSMPPSATTPPTTQPPPPTKSVSSPVSAPAPKSTSSSPAPSHSRLPNAPKMSPASTPPTSVPPQSASSLAPAPLASNARANVLSGVLDLTASFLVMILILN